MPSVPQVPFGSIILIPSPSQLKWVIGSKKRQCNSIFLTRKMYKITVQICKKNSENDTKFPSFQECPKQNKISQHTEHLPL